MEKQKIAVNKYCDKKSKSIIFFIQELHIEQILQASVKACTTKHFYIKFSKNGCIILASVLVSLYIVPTFFKFRMKKIIS